jgi:hypothetical protein
MYSGRLLTTGTPMRTPCILCGCYSGSIDAMEKSYPCPMKESASCDPCLELERLECQIVDLQSLLSQNLDKRRQLRSRENHFHNNFVNRVIHQMPPEVVSEIFEHCMPQQRANHDSHFDSKFDFSVPFVLGAVCRKWRHIAWSTSRLWCSISMDLGDALSQLPLA